MNRIKQARTRLNMGQKEIAIALGVAQPTVSAWESGRKEPTTDNLRALAELLGVSTDFLLGRTNDGNLPVATIRAGPTVRVPILGTIRAGYPIFAEEHIEGYELVDSSEAKGGEFFYLRVKGDSMTGSRIYENDLVYVRKQEQVENGEIAVVLVNGDEATLKRVYYQNGSVVLQPDNSKYPPIVIRRGDVKVIGKVEHVKFKP